MSWTALVPLKPAAERKTRLSAYLSPAERIALSERMLAHVGGVLAAHPRIARALLLSVQPADRWAGDWLADTGRGLNAEIDRARAMLSADDLLVLHADLPLLGADDLDALLDAADGGIALAPDRADRGTNAVAARAGHPLATSFGDDSLRHFLARDPSAILVRRAGLALDVDTPADLAAARAAGFDAR